MQKGACTQTMLLPVPSTLVAALVARSFGPGYSRLQYHTGAGRLPALTRRKAFGVGAATELRKRACI